MGTRGPPQAPRRRLTALRRRHGAGSARYPPFCSATAIGLTINSGKQNGQICTVVRSDQGPESSSPAHERPCAVFEFKCTE